jgi:hypothetical protein
MNKKLPNIFANKVEKKAGNNEKVFYSTHDERTTEETTSVIDVPKKNINQKLNDIFNSSDYIYKADVEIKLKNETVTKRIVGRNSTHLITIDNELIPLTDIIDIKRK